MIPRLKPFLDAREFSASWRPAPDAVVRFEREFARAFGGRHAVAFPYGRTAMRALLESLEIKDAEIILPAYTCVVVAHAIVLSGNRCRFVDATLGDYNMNLDQIEAAINERTAAIVPTHLFGYPLDLDRLGTIVSAAERRLGRRLLIVHDCAHSFGARWRGRLVSAERDVALFGLGISKLMTSIFGGMLVTGDEALAATLRAWRDRHQKTKATHRLLRRLYLLATYAAFDSRLYALVRWVEAETPLLDRLTKAYHLDDCIRFPPDADGLMTDVEAQVGLAQLAKYDEIVARRIDHARYYSAHLTGVDGWGLPPLVDGATYSHYVVRVADREREVARFLREGVQLGELIDYSVPHMKAYVPIAGPGAWPNSLMLSRHLINLPVHADLTEPERERIVSIARAVGKRAA